MSITSAVGARSVLKKMLQDFLDQFLATSFMFAKLQLCRNAEFFDLAADFLQCVSTNLHASFTIVGFDVSEKCHLVAVTWRKKSLPI